MGDPRSRVLPPQQQQDDLLAYGEGLGFELKGGTHYVSLPTNRSGVNRAI